MWSPYFLSRIDWTFVVPGLQKMTFDPVAWELTSGEIINRIGWFIGTLLVGAGLLLLPLPTGSLKV